MENSNFFENNLELIRNCDNLLYDELIKYDLLGYEIENTKIEKAMDGTRIIKSFINQHEWYFNSKYKPKEIAKEWVDKIGKIESTSVITMFGLANGLYLKEIMDRAYESVLFIIYEPSIEIFMKAIKEIDLSFLDKRVFICVEGVNDNYFDAYFQTFITYSNLSVCKYLWHPNYYDCFKKEGKEYLKKIKNGIRVLDTYTNSDIRLSEWYYSNALLNIKFLFEVSILEQIEKVVGKTVPENFPAIIVSAGPSLKKNIKELKKVKNRAFIIATDTALKGLFDENIIPDVMVTIDATKNPKKFDDPRISSIPLISFETSRNMILEMHKGKKIFMNDTFGFGDELFNKMGIRYRSWTGGGSVATNSYVVAMAMGFKTIILVGQDLAYTNNERHYESGLGHSRYDRTGNNEGLFLEVEDINGEKIHTSKDLKIYLDWFEVEISLHNEVDTIDATEGGAKIHGSRIMSLEAAINEKCVAEFNMEEYMKNIPILLDEVGKKELLERIKQIPKQFDEVLEEVVKGVELYTELIKELEKKKPDNFALLEISKKIGENTEKIEISKAYQIAQYKLKGVEYTTLNNLGVSCENATDDALEVSKRGIVMMESLRQVLGEIIPEIKQNIDNIVLD